MHEHVERRRQLQAEEDAARGEGRIPLGQSLTRKWPILHANGVPQFDIATWRFRVTGLVGSPLELTWEQITGLPRHTTFNDIHCVTRWTKLNNAWEGVRATDVLKLAQIEPAARFALIHAPGYSANLPLSILRSPDVLIAFAHDGEPLSPEHGAPARLVVPSRYFWKSVKWVHGIELLADDEPGYWERLGYHNEGDPFAEERFSP
jgi:DMSO/TMAO reductase YedYZ molybdopterin-dependent catalytic subunit